MTERFVYGPVPSRRLGLSLGVDLVPYKVCSYDCIYCQLGRTKQKTIDRRPYIPVGKILDQLYQKLKEGVCTDYVTLAGSGEPTLNSEIGSLIHDIKKHTRIPDLRYHPTALHYTKFSTLQEIYRSVLLALFDYYFAATVYLFYFLHRPSPLRYPFGHTGIVL